MLHAERLHQHAHPDACPSHATSAALIPSTQDAISLRNSLWHCEVTNQTAVIWICTDSCIYTQRAPRLTKRIKEAQCGIIPAPATGTKHYSVVPYI